jgi:hypothetical protein
MQSTDRATCGSSLATWPRLIPIALTGFLLALFGTYWDDAWHTEKGRDSFLIAPHVVLYAGISLTGAALSAWALLATRRSGWRAAFNHPPLVLALLGLVVTLAAAPIDNAWHEAFGRDAVLWSPPHMLGVAGSLLISGSLLLELGPSANGGAMRIAALVAGAAVLGVSAIPVLEYETDVPQFDLVFYLPALAAGSAFALGLVRLALPWRWAAGAVALTYTGIVGVIAVILVAIDMPVPLIPLLAAPALVLDLAYSRMRAPIVVVLFVLALFVAYVPYLDWLKSGIYVDAMDVLVGLPLAGLGVAVALWLTRPQPKRAAAVRRAAPVLAALMLLLPGSALAHDPGQGEELTTAVLTARSDGEQARLSVDLSGFADCDSVEPSRLVARRAGDTANGALRPEAECRFAGEVGLPDRGRWFLYAELQYRGQDLETWIPIHSGEAEIVTDADRSVYVPPAVEDPPLKLAAGVVIYAVFAATLLGIPALYRRRLTSAAIILSPLPNAATDSHS